MDLSKYCHSLCWGVFGLFSSKSFIVSGLVFRSLIYFEFILVYGVRECSNFTLLYVAVQFPSTLIEETVFSPLYILASFVTDYLNMGLFLGLLSCSIDLYFCFCASTILF